jgi:hypothetical protein
VIPASRSLLGLFTTSYLVPPSHRVLSLLTFTSLYTSTIFSLCFYVLVTITCCRSRSPSFLSLPSLFVARSVLVAIYYCVSLITSHRSEFVHITNPWGSFLCILRVYVGPQCEIQT